MARGSGSRTALMLAAGGGKPRALKELLEAVRYSNAIDRGEMLEASDDAGRTALMHAAQAGDERVVARLCGGGEGGGGDGGGEGGGRRMHGLPPRGEDSRASASAPGLTSGHAFSPGGAM